MAGQPLAPEWWSLVANRLVMTIVRVPLTPRGYPGIGPQFDALGFLFRPLCTEDPFIFLLWPQDCTWSTRAPQSYILPLQRRITAVVFRMIFDQGMDTAMSPLRPDAYGMLWSRAP